MNDKEFNAILLLPAPKRYSHFVKKVADSEVVWSLADDGGWTLMANDNGVELVPVWPQERYAEACAVGVWSGSRPRQILLNNWMDKWLPGMARDGRLVAVFPTPQGRGLEVEPDRLRSDLAEELLNYD